MNWEILPLIHKESDVGSRREHQTRIITKQQGHRSAWLTELQLQCNCNHSNIDLVGNIKFGNLVLEVVIVLKKVHIKMALLLAI